MKEQFKQFIEKIKSAKSIAIMGHKNPDGDSFCSVLALAKVIELNFGLRPVCVYDGNIPDYLDLVPLRSWIKFFERVDVYSPYDLAIILDYGTPKHIGGAKPIIDNAGFVVEMDHHKNDEKVGDLCLDDEEVAATGQIVYDFIKSENLKFDINVANLLAVSLITDTGHFRFIRDGSVMRIMAELVDYGVNMRELCELLRNKPKKSILVESGVVADAEFFYHDKLAIATVHHKDYKYLDGRGDTVLNLLGQIQGVEYIVMLKEQKSNQIGLSMRSRGKPINHIAEALGGGGHMCAAGAVVADSLENVRAKVIELFRGE